MPPTLGINPRGLQPRMIWQTDVTHYQPFRRLKYLHISVDTYSGALHATPLTGESAKHIRAHWLEAFSHLGHPQEIKTDNGPGYIAQATQAFLEKSASGESNGVEVGCRRGRLFCDMASPSSPPAPKFVLERKHKHTLFPKLIV